MAPIITIIVLIISLVIVFAIIGSKPRETAKKHGKRH